MERADSFPVIRRRGGYQGYGRIRVTDNIAMANPIRKLPQKKPAKCARMRFATGQSDYPNRVNNVLGFPYIFRGARTSAHERSMTK